MCSLFAMNGLVVGLGTPEDLNVIEDAGVVAQREPLLACPGVGFLEALGQPLDIVRVALAIPLTARIIHARPMTKPFIASRP